MDLLEIRRIVVTAVASDDLLMEELVLKGGNALELAYGIGNRASVDLDYSMRQEFKDIADVRQRLERALSERFDARGFAVFDFDFALKPPSAGIGTRWGGYQATFKLAPKEVFLAHQGDLQALRWRSLEADAQRRRTFKIDISRYEYVDSTNDVDIDAYTVRVYSVVAIAVEKLRALCQQMEEYAQRIHPTARARDVYDIYAIVEATGIDLCTEDNLQLVERIFAAKEVPPTLLAKLVAYKGFHESSWPSVANAVRQPVKPFDFYYDFVVGLAGKILERLGVMNTPS